MSQSTGPILTAGAITWANQTLLADQSAPLFDTTVRIAVATGISAAVFSGLEKISPAFATGLAWIGLVTVLLVRIDNKPTPLERTLDLVA